MSDQVLMTLVTIERKNIQRHLTIKFILNCNVMADCRFSFIPLVNLIDIDLQSATTVEEFCDCKCRDTTFVHSIVLHTYNFFPMKYIGLLVLYVCLSYGQQTLLEYTGSNGFYGGFYAVRAYPAVYNATTSSCTTNPTYVGYQKFNFTLSLAQSNKVYFFQALVEKIQMGFAQMQVSCRLCH